MGALEDDELVLLLRQFGELLAKGAAEDLKALLSGDAKLGVVPKGWKVMPPGSRVPGSTTSTKTRKAELPPTAAVRTSLLEQTNAEARRTLLQDLGMNQTQARQLAKDLGVAGAGRSTIDQVIEKIIGHFSVVDED